MTDITKMLRLKVSQRLLLSCRQQAGLTQEQVAREIGVSRGDIALLEQGRRVPSETTIQKLAEFATQHGIGQALFEGKPMTKKEAQKIVDKVLAARQEGGQDQRLFESAVKHMESKGIRTKKAMAKHLGWAEREFQRVSHGERKISPRKRADLLKVLQAEKAPESTVRPTGRPHRPRTPEKMALGEVIKNAREKAKLPVVYVARKVGFTRSGYSNIERGDTGISKVKLLALGELFPQIKKTKEFQSSLDRAKIGSRPPIHRRKKTDAENVPPPRTAALSTAISEVLSWRKRLTPECTGVLMRIIGFCRGGEMDDTAIVNLLVRLCDEDQG